MDLRADVLAQRFPLAWEDVVAAEVGHVFCDEFEDGVRFIILRGPSSLCAYLGLPTAHPLSGYDYDDLPVEAHGGLTYAGTGVHGDGETYWYGWDYSHSGDYSTYYDREPLSLSLRERDDKRWTPKDVYADAWHSHYEFVKLVGLAEKIARSGWKPDWQKETADAV